MLNCPLPTAIYFNRFLADSANQRKVKYGESIENRNRFILEVVQELINTIGGQKGVIKISPFNPDAGISLDDPMATFTHLITGLNKMDIAYLALTKRRRMFPLLLHCPKDDGIELSGKLSMHTIIADAVDNKDTAEAEFQKEIAKFI